MCKNFSFGFDNALVPIRHQGIIKVNDDLVQGCIDASFSLSDICTAQHGLLQTLLLK